MRKNTLEIMRDSVSERLYRLSKVVKVLVKRGKLDEAKKLVLSQMVKYPDSAEPHNLLGIIEEYRNNHILAMKHFRDACDLDPTYAPARLNIEVFGGFDNMKNPVYNEDDIEVKPQKLYKMIYNKKGIGRFIK